MTKPAKTNLKINIDPIKRWNEIMERCIRYIIHSVTLKSGGVILRMKWDEAPEAELPTKIHLSF